MSVVSLFVVFFRAFSVPHLNSLEMSDSLVWSRSNFKLSTLDTLNHNFKNSSTLLNSAQHSTRVRDSIF